MIDLRTTLSVSLTPEAIAQAVQLGHELAAVEIAQVLLAAARRCVETGTDPWGAPWAPLDPDTRSPTWRVGVRTGALLASITATPTAHTPGVTRAEVQVGASYAQYFQGRRPILPLAFDRGFTARGRRSARRVETVDMPAALLAQCVEIDKRHVAAQIEAARTRASASPTVTG